MHFLCGFPLSTILRIMTCKLALKPSVFPTIVRVRPLSVAWVRACFDIPAIFVFKQHSEYPRKL